MISVIIPCYNHAATLIKCLNSLVAQQIELEIIIVNDGSTDSTEEKVNNYIKAAGETVPIIYLKINHGGAPRARNMGAKTSRGDYLLFSDADLVFKSNALILMHRTLQNNLNASYAYSNFTSSLITFKGMPFNATALKDNNYIHTTSLMRRQDFPGFDESLNKFQDWDLWLTMLDKGRIGVFIPKILFHACVSRRGISRWRPRTWYYFWSKIYDKFGFAPKLYLHYIKSKNIVKRKHNIH